MPIFNNIQPQRNGNRANVNTPFTRSYSDTCMISLSGWNQNLSLKIHPAIGKDANGITQYSTDNGQTLITSITQENAIAWVEGIDKYITPAISEKRPSKKVSITVGGNNMNSTKKVLSLWYDGEHCFFECDEGMMEDGTVPSGHSVVHEFPEKKIMIDYDKTTGNYVEETVYSDYLKFVGKLRNIEALTPMVAHSIKYDKSFRNNNNGTSGFGDSNGGFNPGSSLSPMSAPVSPLQSMGDYQLPLI